MHVVLKIYRRKLTTISIIRRWQSTRDSSFVEHQDFL